MSTRARPGPLCDQRIDTTVRAERSSVLGRAETSRISTGGAVGSTLSAVIADRYVAQPDANAAKINATTDRMLRLQNSRVERGRPRWIARPRSRAFRHAG